MKLLRYLTARLLLIGIKMLPYKISARFPKILAQIPLRFRVLLFPPHRISVKISTIHSEPLILNKPSCNMAFTALKKASTLLIVVYISRHSNLFSITIILASRRFKYRCVKYVQFTCHLYFFSRPCEL